LAASRRAPLPTTTALAAALIAVQVLAPGCSQPTDEQPHPGDCPPFTVVDWMPDGLGDAVPTNATIDLVFSGYPDPGTVGDSTVLLSSGLLTRFGSYKVDLITRTVHFRPYSDLTADVTYQITVMPGLRSLQGCNTQQAQRTFQTGDGPVDEPPTPDPPTLAAVLPIFAASCGSSGCHRQSPDDGGGCLAAPANRLSLCDAEAYDALVGVAAYGASDLKRVLPGDPSRSYLLRKLIQPDAGGPPVVPTTEGQRMPPGGPPLADADLRTISDWIAGGALR